ncbi:hypothetical protein [Streptomyces sp. NPDC055085]
MAEQAPEPRLSHQVPKTPPLQVSIQEAVRLALAGGLEQPGHSTSTSTSTTPDQDKIDLVQVLAIASARTASKLGLDDKTAAEQFDTIAEEIVNEILKLADQQKI